MAILIPEPVQSCGKVLDIGANRERYSKMAARQDSAVVAIDSDRAVMGELWRRARRQGLNILPLGSISPATQSRLGIAQPGIVFFPRACSGVF